MKKKKIVIIILILVLCVIGIVILPNGFKKRTDVVLTNYSLLENGSKMKLDISIISTVGYARALKIKKGGDNLYITFYSTFGLLNSKIGAKSEYEIDINPLCGDIYFYNGDGGYKLVLQKDNDEWKIVNNNDNTQSANVNINNVKENN